MPYYTPSIFSMISTACTAVLLSTSSSGAGVDECVETLKKEWEVNRPEATPYVEGDTIKNNPRFGLPGQVGDQAPVLIPIPDFVTKCATLEANRYPLSRQEGWHWIYRKPANESQTINISITTGPSVDYIIEYDAFNANIFGESAPIDLWYTNLLGDNIDIKMNSSNGKEPVNPKDLARLKVGGFIVDTIFFYKIE